MSTVAVIDYGMGNLHSVSKALEHVADGERVLVTSDPAQILKADRVVLPGVGAIRDCMGEIKRLGIDQVVREVAENKPLLGVCVGMQALLDESAENGGVECIGMLPGRVRYFGDAFDATATAELKIPHMGWNQVHQRVAHPMWREIAQDSRFYFVHSYYVEVADESLAAASSDYGTQFTSAVTRGNLFAVQFHPEKSQHAGLQLYANFLRWNGESD
ncbi:imidazole glycerol phosphate synthase subunit HisH [Solemya pervernicosa gill symbiont]|uniref:Imidazole glycerol phosphate synthase subunit HisH n=2 Tax=Gammaproteobacteria incertae sedis TaxID=118884 RepID=A0A1T2L790_9GAMM|nr:imidazole glycerol phosphate synthase subunit HisH [Candidatus Reidiella endopervernicosa]OOZ40967.1 imidazole glycerol phosphate synthase subunit HisH [Solemya pervernicosa gill symbiont]QKQ25015.1 imidazole glycerol phosphate synthase subunit HisH [Candidatus Reidiella endopervernicosa]